jgi:tetratricopeptide (TPR) repeat protein
MRSASGTAIGMKAALVLLQVFSGGCGKLGQLKAMKSFKEANQAYQSQDYPKAAEKYREVLEADPGLGFPNGASTYFYLGSSYDNMYKPSKKGDAANDELLTKAADNYKKGAERLVTSDKPEEKKLAKLSMEYLVAVYGADKLNDPAQAEPIVQRMIEIDPTDPANYFALENIYEQAGAYDAAENVLLKAKEVRPNDPAVYMQLAGYYNRQGQFDKTIDALEQRAAREPNNPEAYHTIATYYWDETYRDFKLKEPQKRAYVQKGLEAVDHAIQLKPDYMEAIVYKGLLLRLQANLEKDLKKQQELLKEATELQAKAEALRKKKAAGVGD